MESFLCRHEGGERSVAGSGGCHKAVRYRKRLPGCGDLKRRGEHSGASRSPRGEARKEGPLAKVGPGEQRRPGRGPYQPRVRALGALLGAPSWKRNEPEPGRIPEGRARPRAPRPPRSRRQRSRSPVASCPPAEPGSRFPDPSRSLPGCFREPPLNKRELARITGASSGCHHVRRRAGNTQKGGRWRALGVPHSPDPLRVLPARALGNSLRPARPRPAFQSGLLGLFGRWRNVPCAVSPARSFPLGHIGLLSQVPSPPEPSPFMGRCVPSAPSNCAAVPSLSDLEKVGPTSWNRASCADWTPGHC